MRVMKTLQETCTLLTLFFYWNSYITLGSFCFLFIRNKQIIQDDFRNPFKIGFEFIKMDYFLTISINVVFAFVQLSKEIDSCRRQITGYLVFIFIGYYKGHFNLQRILFFSHKQFTFHYILYVGIFLSVSPSHIMHIEDRFLKLI